jgi:hypothetical protein
MLDVENSLQAAAKLFGTADRKPRTAPHTVRNSEITTGSRRGTRGRNLVGLRVHMLERYVDAPVQYDVCLRVAKGGQSCRNGQREKRFFH